MKTSNLSIVNIPMVGELMVQSPAEPIVPVTTVPVVQKFNRIELCKMSKLKQNYLS